MTANIDTSTPPAPKVLYRKYRPTKLSDVVGQEQITDTLEATLKQGKIAHAYLFIGPRGTGKTSVARILAHAINQFDYQVEDSYLDIIEIDAASNTGVDNIRELREKAIIAPVKGKYKIYIIDEVHMLTKAASNALLKTLEEPPEHVIFIMATTDAHKVPITISSRTQIHTFRLADPETMQNHLRQIANTEKIKITDDALKIVVKRGGGSFRDSLSLLDQISNLTDQEITAKVLNSALGLPTGQVLQDLLDAYVTQNSPVITNSLQDLLNTGIQPEIIAAELISAIIANPRPELLSLLEELPEVQPPFPEAKLLLAFLSPSKATIAPSSKNNTPSSQPPKSANSPETPLTGDSGASSSKPPLRQGIAEKLAQRAAERQKRQNAPQKPVITAPETPNSSPNDINSTPATSLTFEQRSSRPFTWDDFLSTVRSENIAIHGQLTKVDYELKDSRLHLYPRQKFTKNILDKPGNRNIMQSCLPTGITIEIHDFDERSIERDNTLSEISAIMGDIQEVTGDSPF